MLEDVNLSRRLSKKEYRQLRPDLERRLSALQQICRDRQTATIIVFEGWRRAGKSLTIAALTARLDPQCFEVYPIRLPRPHEQEYPWLWRFWLKTPAYGEIAIFDRSWYGRVLIERVEQLVPEEEWRRAYRDIVDFERTLADDGTLIIKFFFHISKAEQGRRFKKLESEGEHLRPEDREEHRRYEDYLLAAEEMLERTHTDCAPWTIVEATSQWYACRKVFETVIARLEECTGGVAPPPRGGAGKPSRETDEPCSVS